MPRAAEIQSDASAPSHFMEILGLLLDASPALLGLKDLDGHYVFGNRELERLLCSAPGGMTGRSDRDFMLAGAAATLESRDREVAEHGRPAKSLDAFVLADRKLHCASVRFPYRDESGAVIGTGFVAIEVRDREAFGQDGDLAIESAQQTIADLKQAVADLMVRASTDRLTKAWNRSRIEESARHELLRLERYGHPVSLVFLDIDHFKRINDDHGHAMGDAVLQGLCDLVRRCIRATDSLGRWGGEEFLVLLPNSGLASARLLAERIRAAVTAHHFADIGPISASFGVAQCRPGETWEAWVDRADAAMYRAKQGGRNRVEVDALGTADEELTEKLDAGFVRLVWRKTYESGHPVIDEQHRALFEKANSLLAASVNGHGADDVKPLIDDMIESNLAHFRDEEAIMSSAGFPGAPGHAAIHRRLVAKTLDLAEKHAAGALRPGELFEFLAYEVIARHILSEDRKFFAFWADRASRGSGPAGEHGLP